MWKAGWREEIWTDLNQPWDMIVIGGGITGAGVLRMAAAAGLKTLLVEAHDFSFGTSSRSSKLVHGGMRYLYNRQFSVTRESVREREWLLHEARQLVEPLPFLLPNYERYRIPTRQLHVGVVLYDLMAPKWQHRRCNPRQILEILPNLNGDGLISGFRYGDARVDDSRLVLRLLHEAVAAGAVALNYARVEGLLRDQSGKVCGAALRDAATPEGKTCEVQAKVVINASGPWSDELRAHLGAPKRLRKLRGSHLIFPRSKIPLPEALTLFHPRDRRAMFFIPWEGISMIGTTDLDHDPLIEAQYTEPFASHEEIDYLMEALSFLFPGSGLTKDDILSTFAGLRPVIDTGAAAPSKVSRAHALWQEDGLITITGGKLTTFRIMAQQTINLALSRLRDRPVALPRQRIFDPLPNLSSAALAPDQLLYLLGRYGAETAGLLDAAEVDELAQIDPLPNLWAELRWAARAGGVVHLDDLLLRRVRLGLLLLNGARQHFPRIRAIVQPELGWDDNRWRQEEDAYWHTWEQAYSPDPGNRSSKAR